jgi:hypothetical protein
VTQSHRATSGVNQASVVECADPARSCVALTSFA